MDEERKWRLKKCCCLPLRSGMLGLAYFNATVMFLLHVMRDLSPVIGSVIDVVFMELAINISLEENPFIYMLPIICEYIFVLILIHALHTNNASLLFAYMCYVVVYTSCQLLNLFTFFTIFHLLFVGTDSIYFIYVLLLVYSVRVEIRLDKMDLLSPPHQASEVILQPTAPLAQPDKMAADPERTSL